MHAYNMHEHLTQSIKQEHLLEAKLVCLKPVTIMHKSQDKLNLLGTIQIYEKLLASPFCRIIITEQPYKTLRVTREGRDQNYKG